MAFLDFLSAFFAIWPETLAIDVFRYAVPAGLAFAGLWLWRDNPLLGRKIQQGFVARLHQWRELRYSLSSIGVFSLNGTAIYMMIDQGWTLVYFDANAWGAPYWLFSLAAITLAHDAYFYWTHRLMHLPWLFRAFHHVHHRSTSPSPLAAYSFAPAEALVQALFLTIIIFVLPLHPSAIFAFVFFMTVRNVLGHSGYELFPAGTLRHPVLRFSTTHTHHDLHHSAGHHNFGLYFTWWDRWQGTEHPDYAATFTRVVQGDEAIKPVRPKPAALSR